MKAVRQLTSLLLICTGLVFVQGASSATTALEPAQSLVRPNASLLQQLRSDARGSVEAEREASTRRFGFIAVGQNGDLLPANAARAVDKAAAFLSGYGVLLGVSDPDQLVRTSSTRDEYGTTVSYEQVYQGVPVFGGTIRAHLDNDGDLTAVNGTAVPDLALSTTPRLSAQEVARRAVAFVKSEPPTSGKREAADTTGLRAVSTELLVYRTGLVRGERGTNQLAYRVEVTNRANIRDIVFLEANAGKVLNRYSMIHEGLDRVLYESSRDTPPVWNEGDPFPGTLNQDQQNLVSGTGEAYWFFSNAFGRDSYDGLGAQMRTVNNDPTIRCPNANWNGITTNYCNGVTSDDTVAHEWGHAYTEYTHNLIYQWQPGALNESYSDIWGESVDLINDRQNEDDSTAKRADNACSTNTSGLPLVVINTPTDIAKTCPAGPASFGPQLDDTGLTGDVVQATDVAEPADTLPAGTTTDGCSTIDNAAAVVGNIALVDRGRCPFLQKTRNAQAAGAVALVIGNNQPGGPFGMVGADPAISIPTVSISQEDRNLIAGALATDTVNVTMQLAGGAREDSFRWLSGESDPAFGGAIRDMWTPTCLDDPGKVSDAEYHCTPDDGGGVHSNSGVPNHGYALLVDGGAYNGVTVPGIGLTKAAHIYWRAQTAYQTETTDFADHADSLEASCADLTGQVLNELSTDPDDMAASAETITVTDCASVGAMIQAVELRKEPTQCNFLPVLAKNAPSVCDAKNQKRNIVWSETFSKGLGAWNRSEEWVFAEQPFQWKRDSTLPGGRSGTAAFGVDPEGGDCQGGAADFSGAMSMQSDPILIPGSNQRSPRLSFAHYVATETGFDGGNVKVSVNDGPFDVVPASAYLFNPPTVLASAAAGNTSPLAGEAGFTGTDGGQVTGSWGRSHISLQMIGVESGDSVELRFDMGMDGCGGLDGWYVDDVIVSTCKAPTKVDARQSPRPARLSTAPRVVVTVDSLGGQGDPEGRVTVSARAGRLLGAGTLENGRSRMALPKTLRAGVHTLVARYAGSDLHAAAREEFTVRVSRR